ncbi:MAG: DNA polymerase III subunit gamma/tau [Bacilli bacterium]|jgi:DNA polymerase-3 subunit gamma/tau
MAYKALYRTYRPSTFDEVAGQKHIVKTLRNALEKNRIAHAYLFCGPRGTGKTTMAKLFAKALNCESGIGQQCNKCSNCIGINDGSHPDVIEIDAASNNGVEEVRNIIERVRYLPIKGKYKVYIIDEVHMMSSGAFNALLKTLEEPPAHVVFILATTEPYKVLPTIISRCQRYDFTKVSDGDILEKMIEILKKENIQYEIEALNTIVELSDGGVRDALSMLDQVLAYSSNEVKLSDVLDLFGITSKNEKISLIRSLANSDIKVVLTKLDQFIKSGIDIKRLTSELLEILRDLLVFESGGDSYQMPTLKEDEAEQLAQCIDKRECNQMIDVLLKAQSDYKMVSNINSLFEIILLKLCTLDKNISEKKDDRKCIDSKNVEQSKKDEESKFVVEEPIKKGELTNASNDGDKRDKPHESSSVSKPTKVKEKIPDWLLEEDDGPHKYREIDDDTMIKIMVLGKKESRQKMTDKWGDLESLIGHPKMGKFASILRDGHPFVVTDNIIILEYDFDRLVKKINDEKNGEDLKRLIETAFGTRMDLFAITRSDSIRLRKLFSNLSQISKLPKRETIKIDVFNKEEK